MEISFRISDETLRDGEQQVGVVFSADEKEELAHDIGRAGIDFIALMPAAGEEDLTARLRRNGLPIVPDVPAGAGYIDQARRTGASRIILFAAASDILLATHGISRAENIGYCAELARHAFDSGMVVDFGVMDASRSDVEYVARMAAAVEPYAEHLILCDTVGCLQPSMTAIWVKELAGRTGMPIGIHCHNDLGMAVDNTICAVLAGAVLVSTTFTGIGERAGNAATEQVLLRLREEHGVIHRGVDYGALEAIARKVARYAGRGPANPLSREAFYTESDMHAQAMLHDPAAYSIFPNADQQVWFGKYSGVSNYRWLFERKLGTSLDDESYERMKDVVKELSIEWKKSFSADEVMALYEEQLVHAETL